MKNFIKSALIKVLIVLILPLAVYAFFAILRPDAFLKLDLPLTLLNQCISGIVLAWGMMFVMMIGNMDFSVVAERILGAIFAINLTQRFGVIGLIIGLLLNAFVLGFLKAFLLAVINIKDRVISIAYTIILGSLGYLITSGDTVLIDVNELGILSTMEFRMVFFVVLGIVMYILHKYSLFGAQCKALSGNEALALSSGINKNKVEGIATIVCSLYIAASGLLTLSRGGGETPQSGLASFSLVFVAISGVFIALALSKHISMPIGILIGNYTMNMIIYGLIALNLPSQLTTTVNGGFLLLLLIVMELKSKRDAEKERKASVAKNVSRSAAAP
jgi:ribose/xylose/arabinose/galactoside ABC-type transport system permease subunit